MKNEHKTFPVAGVGASAGGVDSLQRLFHGVPADAGMAFVVVQHLDPRHDTVLPDIIAKSTKLPVKHVSRAVKLAPNTIYVLPADKDATVEDGKLRLSDRDDDAQHQIINNFLRSLAHDQREKAVGVVLSGAGSDGAEGLMAVKEGGGITFAESEQSAEYESMPKSAREAGADFSLAPEEIARGLMKITKKTEMVEDKAEAEDDKHLQRIFKLLENHTGIDFSAYKQTTMGRRLQKRMLLNKTNTLKAYADFLKNNPKELEGLQKDVLIHVTHFFRAPEQLRALETSVLPELIKNRPGKTPLKIWIPGCATGEEAYTFAIMLHEFLEKRKSNVPVKIFATDAAGAVIDQAKTGTYSDAIKEHVPAGYLRRYFTKTGSQYRVKKHIREMCEFHQHNVAEPPPYSGLDIIVCRNVLIYFSPGLQAKVLSHFQTALKPTGCLLLGQAEDISRAAKSFTPIDAKHKLYLPGAEMGEAAPVSDETKNGGVAAGEAPVQTEEPSYSFADQSGRQEKITKLRESIAQTQQYTDSLVGEMETLNEELHAANEELVTGNEELRTTNEELETTQEELRVANEELTTLNEGATAARDYAEAIIETTRQPLLVLDGDLRVQTANRSFYRTFQVSEKETKQQLLYHLGNKQWDIPKLRESLEKVLPKKQQLENYEVAHNFETLGHRTMLLNARALEQGSDKQPRMLLAIEDITERKEAEEIIAAQKTEATLHTFFHQAPAAIAIIGGEGRTYQMANLLYQQIFNRTEKQLLGKTIPEAFPEIEDQGIYELFDQVFDTGEPYIAEEYPATFKRHKGKAKETGYFKFIVQPIKDSGGEVSEVLIHAVEITDQVHAREKVAESERRFRALTEKSSDGVAVVDASNKPTYVSPAVEQILGLTPEEIIRRGDTRDLVHPDDVAKLEPAAAELKQPNSTARLTYRLRHTISGEYHWVAVIATNLLHDPAIQGIVVNYRDVTQEMEAQERLRESEKRYRLLVDLFPEGVAVHFKGELVFINQTGAELLGAANPKELIGQPIMRFVHPDYVEMAKQRIKQAMENGEPAALAQEKFLRVDGSAFDVEAISIPFTYQGETAIQVVARDITERKKAEEDQRRRQELEMKNTLLAEQREELLELNQAKDEFISLASHQLRTPATGVKQYLGMLLDGYVGKLDPPQQEVVEQANQGNERQLHVVEDLLQVARADAGEVRLRLEKTDVVKLIEDVVAEQKNNFDKRRQTVNFTHNKGTLTMPIDPGRMRMVLENLIDNAGKYSFEDSQIDIEVKKFKHVMRIAVKDRGVGIADSDMPQLFTKFSRLDNPLSVSAGGSGLGLYWSKKIIDLHGGSIDVASTPGEGSTFTIKLPLER